MQRGKIIFFNKKNKFGFIKDIDSDTNYYVREKNLSEPIEQDDEVEFEIKPSAKGPEAINVKKRKNSF